jgi:hypothetical protein
MARPEVEHFEILSLGMPAWNEFVKQHGYDIRGGFGGTNLAGFDLRNAVMNEAGFWGSGFDRRRSLPRVSRKS